MTVPAWLLLGCIVIATIAVAVGAVIWRKPVNEWLAARKEQDRPTRALFVVAIAVLGVAFAVLTDIVDFSALLQGDTALARREMDLVQRDIQGGRGGAADASLAARLDLFYDRYIAKSPSEQVILLAGWAAIGLLGIVVTIFDQTSDAELGRKYAALRKADRDLTAALDVMQEVKTVVLAKHARLVKAASSRAGLQRLSACEDCALVFDPQGQVQTIVDCAHRWFKSMGTGKALVRVAVYTQVGDYLSVLASTDGSQPDAVTTPNGAAERERYRVAGLDDAPPEALVAQAFVDDDIKIVSDTSAPEAGFTFFRPPQKNYLKSIVAYPLKVKSEDAPFGVIAVDANRSDFFQNDEPMVSQIVWLADEVALRLAFELTMMDYLGISLSQHEEGEPTDGAAHPHDTGAV